MRNDEQPAGAEAQNVHIEVAQPEDIPALQSVATTSWWATYGDYLAASFIEDFLTRAYSRTRLMAQIADPISHFLVVKHGDDLIGFGQVGPTLPRRDSAPVAPADLYRLYFLPEWQRRGLGARLLGNLEAWLREQGHTIYGAYVHERNDPAKHFYARQGFMHKPTCDIQDEWYLVKPLVDAGY